MWDFLFKFNNFDEKTARVLAWLGYDLHNLDNMISSGKMSKEDINLRMKLYEKFIGDIQLLDKELKERNKKEAPCKKGDTFKTKRYGTILIMSVGENAIIFINENGTKTQTSFEYFSKLVSE